MSARHLYTTAIPAPTDITPPISGATLDQWAAFLQGAVTVPGDPALAWTLIKPELLKLAATLRAAAGQLASADPRAITDRA